MHIQFSFWLFYKTNGINEKVVPQVFILGEVLWTLLPIIILKNIQNNGFIKKGLAFWITFHIFAFEIDN